MMPTLDFRRDHLFVAVLALLVIVGFFLPSWMRFLIQTAMASGLVALGVMLQMRAGLVSFGQGLFFCIGGYAVGLLAAKAGITDVALLLPAAALAALVIGLVLGLLLSRYREIFYAMLTLAVSMILYGLLVKAASLGSTDGFNIPAVSYFGFVPDQAARPDWSYALTGVVVLAGCLGALAYLRSGAGAMLDAVRENEIRLSYLGTSPRVLVFVVYAVAAVLSGLGGGLWAISSGHVDPEMTYWTTSGQFVFVALLAGRGSVVAPVMAYFLLELLRTYALDIAPNAWQLILGSAMLAVIVLLPRGLWSLVARART
ncbi:branched-chain amino acid ABC transporter permease [Sagittula sp. NFXS13]|uniref:Branched-chain amino acid transport system permease protein n=1 Tax=Sagittula marina TaxID=943940 RepID=A0A7W6GWB9_9RHOB|nr:branched-chain amino acid ABC transporter permease [Sagittula marina]MBB3988279.1 branched-chain amino acid transport system permease protein [Sagittula marina]